MSDECYNRVTASSTRLLAGRVADLTNGWEMHIDGHVRQARHAAVKRWSKSTLYDKTIFSMVLAYVALTAAYLLWHRTVLTPDQFFILVLVVSFFLRRARTFLWDWLPLIVLLCGYEYVRGLVPLINGHVHFRQMI